MRLLLIQVDFDDGNCPTYHNQIKGIHNVLKAVLNQLPSECYFLLHSSYIGDVPENILIFLSSQQMFHIFLRAQC